MNYEVRKKCPRCGAIYEDDSQFCEEDGRKLVVAREAQRAASPVVWLLIAGAILLLAIGFYLVPNRTVTEISNGITVSIDPQAQWREGREARLPLMITSKSSHAFQLESVSYKVTLRGVTVTPETERRLALAVPGGAALPFSVPLNTNFGDLQQTLARSAGDSAATIELLFSSGGFRARKRVVVGPEEITEALGRSWLGPQKQDEHKQPPVKQPRAPKVLRTTQPEPDNPPAQGVLKPLRRSLKPGTPPEEPNPEAPGVVKKLK